MNSLAWDSLIKYLRFYVPLTKFFTHIYRWGATKFRPLLLRACEQGGTFIVTHLLGLGTSIFSGLIRSTWHFLSSVVNHASSKTNISLCQPNSLSLSLTQSKIYPIKIKVAVKNWTHYCLWFEIDNFQWSSKLIL
jgi:hypothetical protein